MNVSIRVGMRAMGRALGKVEWEWTGSLILSEDYDWGTEPFDFYKKLGEDFDW